MARRRDGVRFSTDTVCSALCLANGPPLLVVLVSPARSKAAFSDGTRWRQRQEQPVASRVNTPS
jgi:hypothetical protein